MRSWQQRCCNRVRSQVEDALLAVFRKDVVGVENERSTQCKTGAFSPQSSDRFLQLCSTGVSGWQWISLDLDVPSTSDTESAENEDGRRRR